MLSDSLNIRNITIKNRFAVPPMVCFHRVEENGYVSEFNVEHYRELARGGFGLIIVEATAITPRSRLHETELGLWEDGQIAGMRRITDAIHAEGAKAFIQLVHAGGNGIDRTPDAPSAMPYRENNAVEMTQEAIDDVIEKFAAAAVRAKAAGFDGVELHGCHGYLLSEFFSTIYNVRTDAYGKDHALITKQVLSAVREACGYDFIIGIRLAAFEPTLEDGIRNAKAIAGLTDFLDISYGMDSDAHPPVDFPCSPAVYGAMMIKRELPEMPVFAVHNINSRENAENALSTGIDMVDIGKAALVDPAFAAHALAGEQCGKCLNCRNCRWNPPVMADMSAVCPGKLLFEKNRYWKRQIRTSGKAVVIKDSRLLAIKLHDSDGDFCILPGGGQAAGELLPDTVRREVAEETGIDITVGDVAFVIEGSEGEPHHRVDIVFRCEYVGHTNARYQPDTNQAGCEWLDIGTLNTAPLYPSRLRRPIMDLFAGKPAPVYLGNECVGDPEITE